MLGEDETRTEKSEQMGRPSQHRSGLNDGVEVQIPHSEHIQASQSGPANEQRKAGRDPSRMLRESGNYMSGALSDSYTATTFQEMLDRAFHAGLARFTVGLSPAALVEAYLDWVIHLALSPGKQISLIEKAQYQFMQIAHYAATCSSNNRRSGLCIEPLTQDKRFRAQAWQAWPFNVSYQAFLLMQQWWSDATTNVPGMSQRQEKVVEFAARQILDTFSPSNFVLTNPEIIEHTIRHNGMNLVRGVHHLFEDWERSVSGKKPVGTDDYKVGYNLATTPGKVIFRNKLIELIQYEPSTEAVHPQPILIVPAWIMKYYILDLSSHNSLVRHLVSQGFTVFMISWRNPGPEHRDLGLKDYRIHGIEKALEVVQAIVPDQKIHAVGYCLGGTLLAIATAAMARDGSNSLETITFLATQTDFTEPGELELFINDSQLAFLEDMMWEQGYLRSDQMAGAFQLLRSNDLIWSHVAHNYLIGERTTMTDLMAWNTDATRMPYRMHSEYLRWLFLNNDLAEGRYCVDNRPIALTDIREPVFVVGTQRDHVAPWRSVFKFHLLADTDVTFVLTSGGHNTGIVAEPGCSGRSYQLTERKSDDRFVDPDNWIDETPVNQGSWWTAWFDWLKSHSKEPVLPPTFGAPEAGYYILGDAPGKYIHEQ